MSSEKLNKIYHYNFITLIKIFKTVAFYKTTLTLSDSRQEYFEKWKLQLSLTFDIDSCSKTLGYLELWSKKLISQIFIRKRRHVLYTHFWLPEGLYIGGYLLNLRSRFPEENSLCSHKGIKYTISILSELEI